MRSFTDHSDAPSSAGGRRWDESEYCIDRASGLLISCSVAPGVYVVYDYKNPLRIEDRIVAGKITITEGGATIIEVNLQSLSSGVDPVQTSNSSLNQVTSDAVKK